MLLHLELKAAWVKSEPRWSLLTFSASETHLVKEKLKNTCENRFNSNVLFKIPPPPRLENKHVQHLHIQMPLRYSCQDQKQKRSTDTRSRWTLNFGFVRKQQEHTTFVVLTLKKKKTRRKNKQTSVLKITLDITWCKKKSFDMDAVKFSIIRNVHNVFQLFFQAAEQTACKSAHFLVTTRLYLTRRGALDSGSSGYLQIVLMLLPDNDAGTAKSHVTNSSGEAHFWQAEWRHHEVNCFWAFPQVCLQLDLSPQVPTNVSAACYHPPLKAVTVLFACVFVWPHLSHEHLSILWAWHLVTFWFSRFDQNEYRKDDRSLKLSHERKRVICSPPRNLTRGSFVFTVRTAKNWVCSEFVKALT